MTIQVAEIIWPGGITRPRKKIEHLAAIWLVTTPLLQEEGASKTRRRVVVTFCVDEKIHFLTRINQRASRSYTGLHRICYNNYFLHTTEFIRNDQIMGKLFVRIIQDFLFWLCNGSVNNRLFYITKISYLLRTYVLVCYDVALRYVTFVVLSTFGILINVLNVGATDVHWENTFPASSVATLLRPAKGINEKEKYENMCVRNADFWTSLYMSFNLSKRDKMIKEQRFART